MTRTVTAVVDPAPRALAIIDPPATPHASHAGPRGATGDVTPEATAARVAAEAARDAAQASETAAGLSATAADASADAAAASALAASGDATAADAAATSAANALSVASAIAATVDAASQMVLVLGRFRETIAAGVADFAVGQMFSSNESGDLTVYVVTGTAPYYETVAVLGGSGGGILGLLDGGTGKALTAALGGIVYSDEDSLEILAAGVARQVLMSNGAAAPSWASIAGGMHCMMPMVAGDYFTTNLTGSAWTTTNGVAGRMDFHPIVPARDVTVDQLAAYVTTGAAGSTVRLGLYADTGAGRPGALLADTGDLATATSSAFAAGAISPVALRRGELYWRCVHPSGTPVFRAYSFAAALPIAQDGSSGSVLNGWRATQTYGALPGTAPSGGSISVIAVNPILMRHRVA